jgi:EAL domain-containing protein (putative c-di-GMP-specific phosphodiesterase class I)
MLPAQLATKVAAGNKDVGFTPVTPEGVETDEQHEQLRTLGCTNAQGFLFSRRVDTLTAGAMIGTYFAGTPSACV